MSQAEPHSLRRTEAAMRRLGAAMDRLEAASLRSGAGDLLLAGELRDARDEYGRLEDTTRVVAARLDDTIARLRGIVGG